MSQPHARNSDMHIRRSCARHLIFKPRYMRGFILLGYIMKAIQFKKTDCPLSGLNDKEIMKEFSGFFEFKGLGQGNRITTFMAANGQEKLIRLGEWILEIDGAIVVLSNEEYQLLQSEQQLKETKDRIENELKQHKRGVQVGIIKPQSEQTKDLGKIIGDSVKAVIKKEGQQGGLLTGTKPETVSYIKPPYIIELEDQIKAITYTVSALACRVEVLSGDK